MSHIPSLCLPDMHLRKAELPGKNNKNRMCHEMSIFGSKIKIVEATWTEISRRIRWND